MDKFKKTKKNIESFSRTNETYVFNICAGFISEYIYKLQSAVAIIVKFIAKFGRFTRKELNLLALLGGLIVRYDRFDFKRNNNRADSRKGV